MRCNCPWLCKQIILQKQSSGGEGVLRPDCVLAGAKRVSARAARAQADGCSAVLDSCAGAPDMELQPLPCPWSACCKLLSLQRCCKAGMSKTNELSISK